MISNNVKVTSALWKYVCTSYHLIFIFIDLQCQEEVLMLDRETDRETVSDSGSELSITSSDNKII